MQTPLPQPESPYEASRRINNIAQAGTITAVQHQHPARVRMRVGGNETDWLPWITGRAGTKEGGRLWWPPMVGEQCLLISPGGDLGQGFVMLGAYSDAMPQGSEAPGQYLLEIGDASVSINTKTITLSVGSAHITIRDGQITLNSGRGASLTLDEVVSAAPDLIAGGRISSVHHTHGGVRRGGSHTDQPS